MEILKKLLFNRKWVKREMFSRVYKEAQDEILETFAGDVDKEALVKANKLVNDLLSPVDLTRIITLNKTQGLIYIGGEKADDLRLQNLKAEAEFLLKSDIWKLLCETPKELAERQMFVASESLDDLKKGKSMLYLLSTQKNILALLSSYSPKIIASNKSVV